MIEGTIDEKFIHYKEWVWYCTGIVDELLKILCEDFDIYANMIVTQVIHLQYSLECGNTYITHLEYEYIFYSVDEHEKRLGNVAQKGEVQTRLKSFKIDNAKIPFDSRCKIFRFVKEDVRW